ncbi:MAG TPA: efflux RND transporter periplasmic adaptor subunit [Pyrinomonadaceae bacterium]|nr:efflux RND transporter periplasmic adaptor subunit [Pyrinomonadaceae bacterium]
MRNKSSLLILILILAVGSVFTTSCGSTANSAAANNSNSQPAIVDVSTAQATIVPIPTYIEATGNLTSDAQTDVAPAVSGKIVEVNFDIGSYVSQGAVLLRLDARDAQIRLEQARAQVEQQRQAVQQAESNSQQALATLRQTQARLGVRDGETFQIRDFSQVKSINAQLELAEKELRRAERLLETGDVSRSIYDQRKSQRDALLGQLDEARSNAAVAIKAIDTARAAYESTRSAVGVARAVVTNAQTQVEAAQKAISDTNVLAPISGYIAERTADVGEYISPNTPNSKIATIVRTSTLRARIDVPEQDIAKVATGQGVSVQTSAWPDRNFAGTVVRISPSLNATARTLTVEAEIQNVDGLLKPGQFATVRITQSKPEPAVMVPVKAVRTVGDSNSVFVVKDGIAREQFVQLGLLENDMIQIKSGVVEGDPVVVSDLNQLTDGAFVRQ